MTTRGGGLSEEERLTGDHRPVLGVFAGKAGIVGCSCMDARQWRSYLYALGDRSMPAWRAHFAEQIAAHTADLAAQVASANAVADSMQHFADVAERCEAISNDYAARHARVLDLCDEADRMHGKVRTTLIRAALSPAQPNTEGA